MGLGADTENAVEVLPSVEERIDRVLRIARGLPGNTEREQLFDALGNEFCLDCGTLLPPVTSDEDHLETCPYADIVDEDTEDDDVSPRK